MKLSVTDWRITSKCNNNCNFCYGTKGVDTADEIDKIIDGIKATACEAVCITGGEPLLEDKVFYIIEKLHQLGVSVYLSTNGTKYMANRNRIEPFISKLSLPLDGVGDSNTVNGRENDSYQTVKEILDYYEINKPNFRIKIGTVMTKSNMMQEHFEDLFNFISNYSIINKWKIFELLPEGVGAQLYQAEGYTSEDYDKMQDRIEKFVSSSKRERSFEIDFSRRQSRDGAYFIIIPNGDVIIPIDNGNYVDEINLGNIIVDDISGILSKWESHCNDLNCFTNFEKRIVSKSIAISLDSIDKKLLYFYDSDPLELDSTLHEKLLKSDRNIKITKEEIENKLQNLYSTRAINHVMPLINIASFNLNLFLCNLYFKPEMRNQVENIASFLCYNENIAWVAECYDWKNDDKFIIFRIAVYAKNNADMYKIINVISSRFNTSLYKWEIDNVPDKNVLGQRYIKDEEETENSDDKYVDYHIKLDGFNTYRLTKKQYKFFKFPKEEKYTLSNIASYMEMRESKVRSLINNLLEKGIIQKFQAVYNHEVLGYKWYKFFIKFNNPNDKDVFEESIMKYVCVMHTNTLIQGTWDMDFEIQVKNSSSAFNFWDKVLSEFSDKIADEKIIRINKEYKFDFLPQVVLKTMEESVKGLF